MRILTLTSDLGTRDYYLAAVKAAAYRLIPDVQWVDVSNHIAPFNMNMAAFVLGNVWREFPPETIHLIGVDTEWSKDSPFVIVKKEDHFFIGTDNGFFSLLFRDEPADEVRIIRMRGDEDPKFPLQSVFVPTAAHLAKGADLDEISERVEEYRRRPSLQPVVSEGNIRGTVIYVDAYGNVITNIRRTFFQENVGSKSFQILLRRGDNDLKRISTTYSEVPQGDKVAIFNSSGFLELAINRGVKGSGGGASELLGLREGDIIRIEIGSEPEKGLGF